MKINYDDAALGYAEKWGIIEYDVEGNTFIYKEKFIGEGTYNVTVDLNTGYEIERKQI